MYKGYGFSDNGKLLAKSLKHLSLFSEAYFNYDLKSKFTREKKCSKIFMIFSLSCFFDGHTL